MVVQFPIGADKCKYLGIYVTVLSFHIQLAIHASLCVTSIYVHDRLMLPGRRLKENLRIFNAVLSGKKFKKGCLFKFLHKS